MTFVWVPEAPNYPGLYAPAGDSQRMAYIHEHEGKPSATRSFALALKFPTKEECAKWCQENPHPVYVPVEHGVES